MGRWVVGTIVLGLMAASCAMPRGPESIAQDGGAWVLLGTSEQTRECWRQHGSVTFTDQGVVVLGGIANTAGAACGGIRFSLQEDGGGWLPVNTAGPPLDNRVDHVAVWTGSEIILWGGRVDANENPRAGAYDPVSDAWRLIDQAGQPDPREHAYEAAWTGSEMIVWAGPRAARTAEGDAVREDSAALAAYDPATDRWRTLNVDNSPPISSATGVVWTGHGLVVWGGYRSGGVDLTNQGAVYGAATDSWEAIGGQAPAARTNACVVLVDNQLVVWGGQNRDVTARNDGGVYDLTTEEWDLFRSGTALVERSGPACGSTGELMFAIGGSQKVGDTPFYGIYTSHADGALFDPASNTWYTMPPCPGLEDGVAREVAWWDGNRIVLVIFDSDNDWVEAWAYTPGAAGRQ